MDQTMQSVQPSAPEPDNASPMSTPNSLDDIPVVYKQPFHISQQQQQQQHHRSQSTPSILTNPNGTMRANTLPVGQAVSVLTQCARNVLYAVLRWCALVMAVVTALAVRDFWRDSPPIHLTQPLHYIVHTIAPETLVAALYTGIVAIVVAAAILWFFWVAYRVAWMFWKKVFDVTLWINKAMTSIVLMAVVFVIVIMVTAHLASQKNASPGGILSQQQPQQQQQPTYHGTFLPAHAPAFAPPDAYVQPQSDTPQKMSVPLVIGSTLRNVGQTVGASIDTAATTLRSYMPSIYPAVPMLGESIDRFWSVVHRQ